MIALCDSSVLIAALLPSEPLNETFATLTGGSLGFRVDAGLAARLIREQIVDRASVVVLDSVDVTAALDQARAHGVRDGAVYDYMHLVAARKAKAEA